MSLTVVEQCLEELDRVSTDEKNESGEVPDPVDYRWADRWSTANLHFFDV